MSLTNELWIGFVVLSLLLWSIYREVARRPLGGEAVLKDTYLLEVRCLNELGCETLLWGDEEFGHNITNDWLAWPRKRDWVENRVYCQDDKGDTVAWMEYEVFTEITAALLRYRLAERRYMSASAAAFDVALYAASRGPMHLSFERQIGALLSTKTLLRHMPTYVIPTMRRPKGTVWAKSGETTGS